MTCVQIFASWRLGVRFQGLLACDLIPEPMRSLQPVTVMIKRQRLFHSMARIIPVKGACRTLFDGE